MTIWDLRGLEHSVAAHLIDGLTVWLEDTPYFDRWVQRRHRLDVPFSEFPKVFRFLWRRYPLSRVLADVVEETFGVRCTRRDALGWRTLGDAVKWVSPRLDPVYAEDFPEDFDEDDDMAAQVKAAFSTLEIQIAWGPGRWRPISEINESTPCWCGSGRPHLRCCGISFLPKPEYACGVPAWLEARGLGGVQ